MVVLGGSYSNSDDEVTGDIEVWDIADPGDTKRCFKPAPLPRRFRRGVTAFIDDTIAICGGDNEGEVLLECKDV